jgi:fused signal recognition particle receptor
MAGFFKKLFNRITGRPSEEAVPEVVEQAALPPASVAPEPASETPPLRAVKQKAKTPAVQKVVVKALLPKKPEAKKPELKKTEAKKPGPKKSEPKKLEVKTPEPNKVKAKKAEAKKLAPKKPEPKKPEPKPAKAKGKVVSVAPAPMVVAEKIAKPLVKAPPAKLVPPPAAEFVAPVAIIPEVVPPSAPVPAPEVPPAAEPVTEAPQQGGWFSRLRDGLSKSSKSISGSITAIFTKKKLDKETLQDLEDTLIQADLGLPVAERIIAQVSHGRYDKEIDPDEVRQILAAEVAKVLKPVEVPFNFGSEKPYVIVVVGVNGSGKTTTIGKLGAIAAGEGFKVKFAAGDTFRAAAIEQLTVWGNRIGAKTLSRPQGADSAGLAFDALKEAQEDGTDILFIDTAGRLQNKAYLMDELDKMVRVIKKLDPAAPHAVLLVLDATTGQNALTQAEIFTKVAGVTGLIMTKLDGTARGGILVAIAEKFKLPIHAIGVGEAIDDLQPFDANGFARAIAGLDEE